MRNPLLLGGLAVVAVVVVVLLVMRGNDSTSTTTTTAQSPTEWATSLCTATSTYVGSLTSAAAGLKSNVSRAGLDDAKNNVKSATSTYRSALADLGTPNTSSGQQAQQDVEQLSTSLQGQATKIKQATSAVNGASGLLNAISVVTGALVSAKNQVGSTVQQLKALPTGELQQAVSSTDACTSLKT